MDNVQWIMYNGLSIIHCTLSIIHLFLDPSVFFPKKAFLIIVEWIFSFVGQFHALIYEAESDGILSRIFTLYSSNTLRIMC